MGGIIHLVLLLFRVYALVGRTRTSAVLLSVLGFVSAQEYSIYSYPSRDWGSGPPPDHDCTELFFPPPGRRKHRRSINHANAGSRTEPNWVLLLATGVNIPSIFPKCSVGEANIVINNLMVVAPINIIVFETSERAVGSQLKM